VGMYVEKCFDFNTSADGRPSCCTVDGVSAVPLLTQGKLTARRIACF
jgi:hypothetical protein